MRTVINENATKDDGRDMTVKVEDHQKQCNEKAEKIQDRKMESFKKDVIGTKDEVTDLESVLRELKIYGRYHIKFMVLLGMLAFGSFWHSTNYVFAVENVGYRCKYLNCGYTELSTLNLNSSFDYKCHKYVQYNSTGICNEDNFDVSSATKCKDWVYDRPDSFVAEFNLGCEDWKRTLIGTMHSVGYMMGLFLVGPLSDKFGRKAVVIITAVACAVIGLCKSLVYSYWLYVALETIEPLLGDCYSATFTLAIETVTKEHRPLIIFVLSIFTTLGGMSLAVIAWLSPNWRFFLKAIYAPGLLFIFYIYWMDDSVRWLLNKGKKKEVDKMIRQAAKTNKMIIDETKLANLKCEENSAKMGLKTLVKMTVSSKKLFLRLLCCICMWFTALFNAYSLIINSVSLKGNKYLNYGLTVTTGLPASVAILYLLTKCQRKRPLIFSFLLTGAFCIAHSVMPTEHAWLSILLYMSGKLCSTVSIRIVYIYTSELFPTYTRNTMHALCSALARVAAIIAPQTPLLVERIIPHLSPESEIVARKLEINISSMCNFSDNFNNLEKLQADSGVLRKHFLIIFWLIRMIRIEYWHGLPSLIMGILSLLTACVVTLLPDTSDDVLPDNVGQAEAVGKKEKDIEVCPGMRKKEKCVDVCSRL